ncbi:MAG: YfhO family protein [Bacilli bacterium]|nr:YfhO family protein [Bacilli bacterium]
MKSNKKNYLIIIIYGIILTILLLGSNNLYGSCTDWINQHTVIPDYFRKLFYETGNLLPNFAFNLGAGQNIFNFCYYGLLSPIILLSYLLPFIDMTTYIIFISIILYLSSGILLYKFLNNNNFENKISLVLSICFLTLSPITFHFHHHIMFVYYIPFLILALIGIDKYINKNKSFLLMFSIFLIIMTNYYYSISALLVIIIYGIYKLLGKQESFVIKIFIKDILKASLRVIVPVLLSGIILFPALYITFSNGRETSKSIELLNLLIPNLKRVLYNHNTLGLCIPILLSSISLLCTKLKKKNDIFLGYSLLIITLIPIFMYLLNGFLYIRGKVLIPFSVLYIYTFAKFINNMINNNINFKKLFLISIFIIILSLGIQKNSFDIYIIDFVVSFILFKFCIKYKSKTIILIYSFTILLITAFSSNINEDYVSIEEYKNINNPNTIKLLKKIDKGGFYRTDNYNISDKNVNKVYQNNYFNTSIYSSNYNKNYWNFYHKDFKNNLPYRNKFITAGANNILFSNFMGVKYIISGNDDLAFYEKIDSSDNLNLYYNENVNPIIYTTDDVGSYGIYKKLKYPYNIEYLINKPVTNSKNNNLYETKIKKLNLDINESYDFEILDDKTYIYNLDEPISNKILIITFDMDYNQSCKVGDSKITINGISNKLTCKEWIYHNQNNNFNYVISSNKQIDSLNVNISKGKYKISNINAYLMDYSMPKFKEIDNIEIDKKNSTITGSVSLDKKSYVITSIPYDDGFSVFVDDKKVNTEIVNTAFLGFKITKGNHSIKIKYQSPLLKYGYISSILGILIMALILIYEKINLRQLDLSKNENN